MKKIICFVLAALLLALPCLAVNPIDTERACSLTLQYKRGEVFYGGVEVKVFMIAEASADGSYDMTGAFKAYPVNIYGVSNQLEWKNISDTLASYAVADKLEPDCKAIADNEGKVRFDGLKAGLYLTLGVTVERDGETAVFENFITALPTPAEEGEHSYDVTAYPKCSAFTPKDEPVEYKIVKHWKDEGYEDKRPDAIEVDILCNNEVVYSEKLTRDNDWSFAWTADDGGVWQAVERNVPEGYTVTVDNSAKTIIVTNSFDYGQIPPPQTGDTAVIWPYAIVMAIGGALMLTVSVWRRRREA